MKTTPFTLQAKPRAEYSCYARFYQLEGVVRVRVLFGADGKIGKVTAIKKLPFGLTGMALEASKKLEFTPPTYDGKPVSVTKVIEYAFSIY